MCCPAVWVAPVFCGGGTIYMSRLASEAHTLSHGTERQVWALTSSSRTSSINWLPVLAYFVFCPR